MADPAPIIVTGAGGRIGRLLRALWPGPALWLTRADWDILAEPAPQLPQGAVWLDLAGLVRGDVSLNPAITARVVQAVEARGGRLVHLSSAAVYGPAAVDLREEDALNPGSDYGRSKLAAERVVQSCQGAVILRLGNLAGADALLGVARDQVLLDPVPGQSGGPLRSYIGPHVLADVLLHLCRMPAGHLPPVLNIAQPGAVAMADLLTAAGADWRFGPERQEVQGRVVLNVDRLARLAPLPSASAERIVADLRRLGGWPA